MGNEVDTNDAVWQKLMNEADKDGDDYIDFDEFIQAMHKDM